jgi:hypothetical protein
MNRHENGEGRPDQPTTQTDTRQAGQGQAREGGAVNTPLDFFIRQEVVNKLDPKQPAVKRASQVLKTMGEIQYLIGTWQFKTGQDRAVGEKMAPFDSSIKRIEMAYQIVAYPLLEETGDGSNIDELVRDAQEHPQKDIEEHPHRAPFTLNDQEAGILGQLARATGLTPDPKRQEYSFTALLPRLEARIKATMDSYKAQMIKQRMIDEGILRKRSDIEKEIRKRQMSFVPSKTKPPEPKK